MEDPVIFKLRCFFRKNSAEIKFEALLNKIGRGSVLR
jgi:hypothetical protein